MRILNRVDDWTAWTKRHKVHVVKVTSSPPGPSAWAWEWASRGTSPRLVSGESANMDNAKREGVRSLTKHLRKKAQKLLNEAAEFEKILLADLQETIEDPPASPPEPPEPEALPMPDTPARPSAPVPPEGQPSPGVSRYEQAAAEVDAVLERQRKVTDEG